jgi:hypothetical protein
MIRTAITLASRGRRVFPCLPRDKRPATEHGLKDATTDLDLIRQWWHTEPQYNIGIATGAASQIFVIDVDDLDAEFELRRLEAEHGALPATVEVITARGRHLYFQMPDTPVSNSAGKIAPGIDVRGDGGYVLAPPSVHPSGKQYCWSVDSGNTLAAAPEWLLAKMTKYTSGAPPIPPEEWRALAESGADDGTRDVTITKVAGHLLRHRVDPYVTLTLLQSWNTTHCRPPLPHADIQRIVNSISGKELRRRQTPP